jgi:hypothetical protein
MNTLEQVQQLKQQAISLLLSERQQIDSELASLGYDAEKNTTPNKKRGRPAKPVIQQERMELANATTL